MPGGMRGQSYIGWHCVVEEKSKRCCPGGSSASKHWIYQLGRKESHSDSFAHQLISPHGQQGCLKGFSAKVCHSEHMGSGSFEVERGMVKHLQALGVGQGLPFYSHIE